MGLCVSKRYHANAEHESNEMVEKRRQGSMTEREVVEKHDAKSRQRGGKKKREKKDRQNERDNRLKFRRKEKM